MGSIPAGPANYVGIILFEHMKKIVLLLLVLVSFSACTQESNDIAADDTFIEGLTVSDLIGPVEYNCELSGGVMVDNECECSVAYDESTGFCQSEIGGPAGDAWPASTGLPYGNFEFWTQLVGYHCQETGGDWLNARCTCPEDTVYDQETGFCQRPSSQ